MNRFMIVRRALNAVRLAMPLLLMAACYQKAMAGDGGIISHPQELHSGMAHANTADMAKAFFAAYGYPAPLMEADSDGNQVATSPDALFELVPDLWVLVSKSEARGHVSSISPGYFTIRYLSFGSNGYKLAGTLANPVGVAFWGHPGSWEIRYDLDRYPILLTLNGDPGHGVNYQDGDFVRLAPIGPQLAADAVLLKAGMENGDNARLVYSAIGQLVARPGRPGFDIVYAGKAIGSLHYALDARNFYRPVETAATKALSECLEKLQQNEPCVPTAATPHSPDRVVSLAVIRAFYKALHDGNGSAANVLLTPEKSQLAAYRPDNIANFYGHLSEPLQLLGVEDLGSGRANVHYTYRAGRRTCDGHAIVETQIAEGAVRIGGIYPKSGC